MFRLIRMPLSAGMPFRFRPTGREALRIAGPIMLAAVGEQIVGLLDTAFMGRVGEVELGAVGLATIWYFILLIVGFGMSSGLQILVARRMGEEDPRGAGVAFDQTLTLTLVVGALLYGVQFLLAPEVFRLVTQSEAVYRACITYLDYRSYDLLIMLQIFLLEGFYNGLGENRIVVWSTLTLAGMNALLNYLLVFGVPGLIPPMGIAGVAVASVIAHVASWAVLWGHLHYRRHPQTYGLFRSLRLRRTTTLRLLNLSAPIMLQYLSGMIAFFIFLSLIEKMGETALAASNVLKSVYIFHMIPTWGLGSATSTLVSRRIGQGHKRAVWPTLWHIAQLNLGIALLASLGLLLIPETVLRLFTSEEQVIEATLPLLWVVIPCLWIYSQSGILLNALIGTGASRWSLFTEVLNAVLYVSYVVVIYLVGGSLRQIWMCEYIYVGVNAVVPLIVLRSGIWKRIKV